jgi:hypothetical protein
LQRKQKKKSEQNLKEEQLLKELQNNSMGESFWSSSVTPTDAANIHNLILTVVGTAAAIALGEMIKDKDEIPISSMVLWAGIFGIAMAASVHNISKNAV